MIVPDQTNAETGLPVMDPQQVEKGKMKTILSISLSPIIMTIIGVGFAAGFYETNKK